MPLIYEDDHGEVFFRDGPDDRTLVTFNCIGFYADGQKYWAQPIADKLGLRCIGIISRTYSWFPAAFMRPALTVIAPYLRGRVTIYGNSMGAYGALKYSAALGADTVLAFSPQATISPEELPGNPYAACFFPHLHHDMRVKPEDLGGKSYIFVDRHEAEDMRHLALLPGPPAVELVPVPSMKHDTHAIFLSLALMAELFALSLSRDRAGMDRLIRRAKRLSHFTYRNLGVTLCTHRKLAWAAKAIAKARSLGLPVVEAPAFYTAYASALDRAGRFDEALKAFRMAMASNPANPELHLAYIDALTRRGQRAEARQALSVALSHCPGAPVLTALTDTLRA